MDTSLINPDPIFAQIAFSISRDPASWENWSCLQIEMEIDNLIEDEECMAALEGIIKSCFAQIEGKIYFVRQYVHIICKGLGLAGLQDIGRQVCDMRFGGHSLFRNFAVYDLSRDARKFIDSLHEENSQNKFSTEYPSNPASSLRSDAKVLLIEDDPVTRWMVGNALKNHCILATANCANKAFAQYAEMKPDIVFLDIGLPDKDGKQVLEWILHNDPGANVVMFSGDSRLETISASLEQGAKGFIAKPFLKEKLFHYIRSWT